MQELEQAKEVVRTFNREVIELGNEVVASKIFADGFVNHSAPPGGPKGPEGMLFTFNKILRPALANMKVEILDQIAEGEKVTTRKRIMGKHVGKLMDVDATGEEITIDVIDIVRVVGRQYAEHWGMNNLPSVLTALRAKNPKA